MKRHGFHGVSSSHGAHKNHRKPGSIGGCATDRARLAVVLVSSSWEELTPWKP